MAKKNKHIILPKKVARMVREMELQRFEGQPSIDRFRQALEAEQKAKESKAE